MTAAEAHEGLVYCRDHGEFDGSKDREVALSLIRQYEQQHSLTEKQIVYARDIMARCHL